MLATGARVTRQGDEEFHIDSAAFCVSHWLVDGTVWSVAGPFSWHSHFIANWSVVGDWQSREPVCAANRLPMTIANCAQRA